MEQGEGGGQGNLPSPAYHNELIFTQIINIMFHQFFMKKYIRASKASALYGRGGGREPHPPALGVLSY